MRLKHLQPYMMSVSLRHKYKSCDIAEFSKAHTGEKPDTQRAEIAIDASAVIWRFYQGLDFICGGQPREFVANVVEFVDTFRQCGVQPVFFFGQPVTQVGNYTDDMVRDGRHFLQLFRDLKRHERSMLSGDKNTPRMPDTIHRFVLQVVLESICGVKVLKFGAHREAQIARYARANPQCIGVLSNNSAFFILDLGEHCRFLLMEKELNLCRVQVICFERLALADKLKLSTAQMPLFATALGTCYDDDWADFHRRLCGSFGTPSTSQTIARVADYVSGFEPGCHTKENFYRIAHDLFAGDIDKINKHFDELVYRMEIFDAEGFIESSDTDDNNSKNINNINNNQEMQCDVQCVAGLSGEAEKWQMIVEKARDREQDSFMIQYLNSVIRTQSYLMPPIVEDLKHDRFPPIALIYGFLRKALYWVLLKECPDKKPVKAADDNENNLKTVSEYWFQPDKSHNGEEPDVVEVAQIEGVDHPGLLSFWGESSSTNAAHTNEKRWNILQRAFNIRSENLSRVKELRVKQLFPVLILSYLQNQAEYEPLLLDWELDAILALVVFLPDSHQRITDGKQPDLGRLNNEIDLAAVQIASILVRGLSMVGELLCAVGHPAANDYAKSWLFFDGLWFQHFYRMAKPSRNISHENGTEATANAKPLRSNNLSHENASEATTNAHSGDGAQGKALGNCAFHNTGENRQGSEIAQEKTSYLRSTAHGEGERSEVAHRETDQEKENVHGEGDGAKDPLLRKSHENDTTTTANARSDGDGAHAKAHGDSAAADDEHEITNALSNAHGEAIAHRETDDGTEKIARGEGDEVKRNEKDSGATMEELCGNDLKRIILFTYLKSLI